MSVIRVAEAAYSECSGFSDSRLCREFNWCTWRIQCSESDDAMSK